MIITVCLLLAGIAVQAADALPLGRWEIAQVTYEKITDGNLQTTVYNTIADAKDYIRFPQALEVKDAQTVMLRYFDMEEEFTAEYTLKGDLLEITQGPMGLSYLYSASAGSLILATQPFTFVTKLSTGDKESITEKWTFTLKNQE